MNGPFAHSYQERDRQAFVGASSRWNVYNLTLGTGKDDTLAATERLSNSLGLRATIIPSWGELQLEATEGTTRLVGNSRNSVESSDSRVTTLRHLSPFDNRLLRRSQSFQFFDERRNVFVSATTAKPTSFGSRERRVRAMEEAQRDEL